MLKGFKDFIMRGNVLELAVAVVMGTAFTAVVTAVVNSVLNPLIASFGGANVTGLSWQIVSGNAKSTMDFAAVITAIINFLLIAVVVYFLLVMPMKRIQERRRRGEEAGPSEPTQVEVLMEIRDLLQSQQRSGPAQTQGGQSSAGQSAPGELR
ncbi:large conductance mechanosensitive channel protein MscL [Kibdelosporangium persicum]|uniref:Large-conductance mechanosensitive channel n=1 Tax=Kibdelosporangium persicum TaxID=2698649 RepID=A0ABX2FH76_9PSEU|nr:large conductance mechanosensitive channel protein MscL [Kibdelosporangium persicum]NRN70744.1 Large-conductance mechanosensitive channel protein MscL [Kibdelosporangium persicum]